MLLEDNVSVYLYDLRQDNDFLMMTPTIQVALKKKTMWTSSQRKHYSSKATKGPLKWFDK